jgi:Tol biopolymer transport system component
MAFSEIGLLLIAHAASIGEAPPYTSKTPLTEPTMFAPGVISTGDYESHPAFTPDGKTIYFLKDSPDFVFWTIFTSTYRDGQWSTPTLAPFSGHYKDADPFITRDGKHFFFISDRPVPGKSHHDLDIWTMDAQGAGWSEPRHLDAPIASDGQEWYPTVADDGTLYFGSNRPGGKGLTDLYRAKFVGGKYAEPENLGDAINTARDEYEPSIAPDQSFLIFMADNREGRGDSDIFISWNCGGQWTKSVPLADGGINSAGSEYSPKFSPDGRYFFWTSTRATTQKIGEKSFTTQTYLDRLHAPGNGLGDIYQIDRDALKLKSACISESHKNGSHHG